MLTRSTLLRLSAAIVGIGALAVVAATIPEVLDTPSSGGVDGGPGGSQSDPGLDVDADDPIGSWILYVLAAGLVLALLISLLGILFYDRRELLALIASVSVAVAGIVVLLVIALNMMEQIAPVANQSGGMAGEIDQRNGGTGEGSGDTDGSTTLNTREFLLLGTVLLAALLGAVLLKSRLESESKEAGEATGVSRANDVGAAAGDAADRIEGTAGVPIENAVYDAWLEMTSLLSVENPSSSTPGEFADAAVEAGLDRSDVEELTDLFEAVRYGSTRASSVEERRAVASLRRIEATYTDEHPESGQPPRDRSSAEAIASETVASDEDEQATSNRSNDAHDGEELDPGRDEP